MSVLSRLLAFFKSQPAQAPTARPASTDGSFVDAYRRVRPPSTGDLLAELKYIASACLNAATCAAYPPRLYVRTGRAAPAPKCGTKTLPPCHPLAVSHKGVSRVEEVIGHPLLSLFRQVN